MRGTRHQKESGERRGQATDTVDVRDIIYTLYVFGSLREHVRAKEYLLKALSTSREIGDREKSIFVSLQLNSSIKIYEELGGFIGINDH